MLCVRCGLKQEALLPQTDYFLLHKQRAVRQAEIGNESVPTQLAQCWFPGLAISNAKI